MISYLIIVFLALSLVLYCLLGGADFGAGILEIFMKRQDGKSISDVIGPVWEANHVWLILAVMILFVGFPPIYAAITTYLHIPLMLLLVGIIMRGTAFAFLHYDAIKDRSNAIYQWVFNLSSVITPLFLGVTAGALIMGNIESSGEYFWDVFIAPWFNGFAFSVGIFCTSLFAFLASIFMIGEMRAEQERSRFVAAAKITQITTVLSGGFVFANAQWYDLPLVSLFLNSILSIVCIILATISLSGIWIAINRRWIWISRLIAGAQLLFILSAWFWVQHPVVVKFTDQPSLTFFNSMAPESTQLQLLIALIVGACLILPSLFFLFHTFKTKQTHDI